MLIMYPISESSLHILSQSAGCFECDRSLFFFYRVGIASCTFRLPKNEKSVGKVLTPLTYCNIFDLKKISNIFIP